ncbi:MAG TPA: DUF2330 domain-containing protein [Candidatus Wallbacteria bacterium]|nr:DUF2330 domain-containing protein [Candidatus Wallbacteria bacterium]
MNNFIKIIVFILMYFSSPCAAYGDGLVLGYFERDWRMVDEKSQLCFIGHSGDTENILLAVNFDDRSGAGKVAWIFPVPSSPESVEIDIIKEFPETVGASLEVMYNKKLDAIFQNVLLTQVITLPVFFFRPMMMAVNSPGADLKVYKSIASMGVVTQLVSAKDQAALKNYIEAKGLKFPENLLKVFEKYTRWGYCFVISWIDDFEKFKRENEKAGSGSFKSSIGVFAAFPSREIYFPLTPTSAYNEKIVPLVLYIMGHHVEPNFYDRIKPYSKCDLEISEKYRVPEKLSRFFFGNKYFEKLDFSVISINAPSSLLVEDLKISPRRSAKSKLFGFISEKGAWVSVVLIVIFSCLASLLADFRRPKPAFFFSAFSICCLFLALLPPHTF